ncbi:MAG: DUF3524 domain-containing protein [Actinomycetota bacterium]|nr:DUF3524 domain-containing protein [Actinomycetota bacterium]
MSDSRRVLLVEPYHGGSHAAWADGLVRHSRHRVVTASHEGEFWRWRMRGGSLTLAEAAEQVVAKHGRPEVVLVSGMVDLAAWLGFSRRFLGDPAVVLYLHENQLVYPLGPGQRPDEGLQIANWTSMAVADEVWCNSTYQRDSLFRALPALLSRAPDNSHAHRLEEVRDTCRVVPVGVELSDIPTRGPTHDEGPPLVLWNHRWDYDKNPQAVFRSLTKLAEEGVDFRLAIAGENTRVDPREFTEACLLLGDRVVQVGYLSRLAYTELLGQADVVVSAARHEFFGIAVVEAIAGGAVPVLPCRLSYPELIAERYQAVALYPDGGLTTRLREVLEDLGRWRSQVAGLAETMRRFDWSVLIDDYDTRLENLAAHAQLST